MYKSISANFKADFTAVPPSFTMKHFHEHDKNELFFMIDGICTIYIEDKIYKVQNGNILLIPAGVSHKTTYIANYKNSRIILYFNNEELDWLESQFGKSILHTLRNNFVIQIPEKRRKYVIELLESITYEFKGVDYMSISFVRAYFYQLMLFLLRCQMYKENVISKMDVANEQIQKVIEYIIQNFRNEITLSETADFFSISQSNLSKKFKAFTGYRFKEYVIDLKTHAAADALINTNLSITDIALQCGFSDSNSFGDTFKRIYRVSPSEYRKRC